MTQAMQDQFEQAFSDDNGKVPVAFIKLQRLGDSYSVPRIARAWYWFKRSREMLVVQLPEFWDCGAGGMVIGEDELLTALGAAGLKVTL